MCVCVCVKSLQHYEPWKSGMGQFWVFGVLEFSGIRVVVFRAW